MPNNAAGTGRFQKKSSFVPGGAAAQNKMGRFRKRPTLKEKDFLF
jgi:hypothetical protein